MRKYKFTYLSLAPLILKTRKCDQEHYLLISSGQIFKLESFWESRSLLNIYQTFERAIDIYFVCKVNWIKVTKHQRVIVTYHRVFKLWWHEDCLSRDKATLGMLSWFLFIAQVAMEGDILANRTDIKNTRTSNCWFRLLLVECKAKRRSISNLSETAAAMNFIKYWQANGNHTEPYQKHHVSNRPSLRSVSLNIKVSKAFRNKRDLKTFCVIKPKKGKLYPPSIVKRSSFSDALMSLCTLQIQL